MRKVHLGSALAVLTLLLVAACDRGPQEPARVSIEFPTEGAEVEGPDVMVRLGAANVRIVSADIHEAGTGHHHIFVNTDVTPLSDTIPAGVPGIIHMGQGQTEFLVTGLEPGEHRLIAVLADHAHVPLDPPAVDTVRFRVIEPGDDGQP
jgi:hypothetical protein